MKRIIAVAAAASLITLLAFTGSAAADGHAISVDPMSVDEPGTHLITVSAAAGWPEEGTTLIACPGYRGVKPEPPLGPDVVTMCDMGNIIQIMVDSDGSFSADVELDIGADGLVILVGNLAAGLNELAVIHVGMMDDDMDAEDGDMGMDGEMMDEDMHMDDMDDGEMPMGGAMTGFGGTAGDGGIGSALPLAAGLLAVTVLGGAAIALRRNN